MRDWVQDVLDFHKAFGLWIETTPKTPDNEIIKLRLNLVDEELEELRSAIIQNDHLEDVADACADLIYVVIGTAISYGIDLRPIWDEVQKANMAKVGGRKRADGKWLKPEGWTPPDIKKALKQGKLKK